MSILFETKSSQTYFSVNLQSESYQTRKPGDSADLLPRNVFVMIICIDARIPLILVGKPGSSKSLAMQVPCDTSFVSKRRAFSISPKFCCPFEAMAILASAIATVSPPSRIARVGIWGRHSLLADHSRPLSQRD